MECNFEFALTIKAVGSCCFFPQVIKNQSLHDQEYDSPSKINSQPSHDPIL